MESCSLMTSVETRDLSRKADRSRVNSNTKRVGKSRHVDGGMFTTVAILYEKSFRSLIEVRSLQLHVCRLQWSSVWWWVLRGTQRLWHRPSECGAGSWKGRDEPQSRRLMVSA